MTLQELKEFRQRLLALRDEISAMEEADNESKRPVELDQPSIGRLSRMDALQAQQMAQETARRRQQQLQRIEGALRRIDNDDFGYCALCEEEIDRKRLNIDPTTTRCIDCMD
ncbi:MAG: TraR/DksA C4-type zinc finger protein [Pseudohongiellaceae bacterium]